MQQAQQQSPETGKGNKMGNVTEKTKATGDLFVRRYDEKMNLVEEKHIPNLVVTTGLNYMASRILSNAAGVMSHMAVGTGAVAPVAGNLGLGTEIRRQAFNSSTVSANTVTYQTTYTPGFGTGVLTEAGIFDAASAGNMLCRTVFGVVTKGALDTVSITWTVTINAA
jgi:hypothetical protein